MTAKRTAAAVQVVESGVVSQADWRVLRPDILYLEEAIATVERRAERSAGAPECFRSKPRPSIVPVASPSALELYRMWAGLRARFEHLGDTLAEEVAP